jgi:YD repeat-containing protein
VRVQTGAGATIAEYTYDPHGHRLSKTVAGVTTYFLYTQEGLAAEYDALGNPRTEYHFAPGYRWMSQPLFMREAGKTYYYHTDQRGAPVALFDQSGLAVWEARYSAFGAIDGVIL